ncbi:hypothetical protein MBANPS3_005711 [Mucor bainieri]
MTQDWRKLPLEVWINVFYFLPCYSDIAECRLVCRTWDAPAEKTMFKIGLTLGITRQMKRLCYHLTQKPAVANAIHFVDVSRVKVLTDLPLLKELLLLILHCNISKITGYSCPSAVIEVVHEILQNSPTRFNRLRQLPNPQNYNETYSKLIYAHRETLGQLKINYPSRQVSATMDYILTHLHEFSKLVHVEFNKAEFLNLEDLDNLLQSLPESCKSVDIHLSFVESFSTSRSEAAMNNWLHHHVKKANNVTKLKIDHQSQKCIDNVIEYFTYKYPNLDRFVAHRLDFDNYNAFQRSAVLLSQISQVDTWYSTSHEGLDVPMETARIFMSTRSNILRLSYEHPDTFPEMSVKRNKAKGTSDLLLQFDSVMTNEAYVELLALLGSSRVPLLAVDLFGNKSLYQNHSALTQPTLLDIVSTVPQVEDFRFTETCIPNFKPGPLILEKLKRLHISGAEIGSLVLPTISNMAPHLETLELESCVVLNSADATGRTICIQLPCSSISALSVSLIETRYMWRSKKDHIFVHYRSIFRRLKKIKRSVFVRLTTSESCVMRGETPMLITKEEYLEYSKGLPMYDIECKSLSFLEFKLKSFRMKLQFKDGKLENGRKSKIKALEDHGAEIKNIVSDVVVAKIKHDFDEMKKELIAFKATKLRQEEPFKSIDVEEAEEDFDENSDEEDDYMSEPGYGGGYLDFDTLVGLAEDLYPDTEPYESDSEDESNSEDNFLL